jgi:L-alanine-DL-glutamate epimerase-like enolase superfamily enzyme
MQDAPLTSNGWVGLRDRPGFGIELDASSIERQAVLTSI